MGAACGRTRPARGEGARSWAGVGSGAFPREGLRALGRPWEGALWARPAETCPETQDRSFPGGGGRGSLWAQPAWGRGPTSPPALGEGAVGRAETPSPLRRGSGFRRGNACDPPFRARALCVLTRTVPGKPGGRAAPACLSRWSRAASESSLASHTALRLPRRDEPGAPPVGRVLPRCELRAGGILGTHPWGPRRLGTSRCLPNLGWTVVWPSAGRPPARPSPPQTAGPWLRWCFRGRRS